MLFSQWPQELRDLIILAAHQKMAQHIYLQVDTAMAGVAKICQKPDDHTDEYAMNAHLAGNAVETTIDKINSLCDQRGIDPEDVSMAVGILFERWKALPPAGASFPDYTL